MLIMFVCGDRRRRQWHPTPVLLPGISHGRRSLVGCSQWSCEKSDTTERLHFHFSLSCTGEGNGNPLQCSCLENPRDGGAWWAAVYGVAQSRTRLKRLRSMGIGLWRKHVYGTFSGSDAVTENITHRAFAEMGDPLDEELATHSSTLAEIIPWTESLAGQSPWSGKE